MTLFHNLFGTDASFNIWSSDIKTYMRLIITDRTKIIKLFTVCTERVRSPYTEHAVSGLPNPTPLEREVLFIQAQDQQLLSHVVREWWQSVYSLARC